MALPKPKLGLIRSQLFGSLETVFLQLMKKAYYVMRAGKNHGKFTLEQVKSLLGKKDLHAIDLIWEERAAEWVPASEFVLRPELSIEMPKAAKAKTLGGTSWKNWAFGLGLLFSLLLLTGAVYNYQRLAPIMDSIQKSMKAIAPQNHLSDTVMNDVSKEINQPLRVLLWLAATGGIGLAASMFIKKGGKTGVVLAGVAAVSGLSLGLWFPESYDAWISAVVYSLVTFLGFKRVAKSRPIKNPMPKQAVARNWDRLEEYQNKKVWKI